MREKSLWYTKHLLILILYSLLMIGNVVAQNSVNTLKFRVMDSDKAPLQGALVELQSKDKKKMGVTDASGLCVLSGVPLGSYQLTIRFVGLETHHEKLTLPIKGEKLVLLSYKKDVLEEVVVTAKSSKGLASGSVIGKDAMQHIQPTSFADLLELLPGGLTSTPSLTTPNQIRLREANIPITGSFNMLPRVSSRNYTTDSQGVAFIMDGIPIQNEAGMQKISGAWDLKETSRIFLNRGVDMRGISTDDIESVEIIRGIPSVEYSNLTSGLVKIKRKQGLDRLEGRFKADMGSQLFYIGKGVNLADKDFDISGSMSYLSAYADPRDVQNSYKRVIASLRGSKIFRWKTSNQLQYHFNLDYTGSFDNDKQDPDLHKGKEDAYNASYNQFAISQSLQYRNSQNRWLSEVLADFSFSHTDERTKIVKFVQHPHSTPYTDAKEEGEHEGKYYPYSYTGRHIVEGKPTYLYARLKGGSLFQIGKSYHHLIWGGNWNYSKNYGKGAIYDIDQPVFSNAPTRPRPFDDIPANNRLSLFLEDKSDLAIGDDMLTLSIGLAANSLLGLEKSYAMCGKWYWDFRANAKYSRIIANIKDQPLRAELIAGIGTLSMFPTMTQLYPDKIYYDNVQLNYFHNRPEFRLVNIRTYIFNPINYQLKPASNLKREVRLDLDWGYFGGSVTYFNETMSNGFRPMDELLVIDYKKYDASHLPHGELTSKPDINTLPYSTQKRHLLLERTDNGSETRKEGVEWTFHTPRFPSIYTRFTFSGAWFKTTYKNSLPQYEKPNVIISDKEIPFIGIYQDTEGLISETLNTDLRADTYIPHLGLGVSLSFQSNWFSSAQRLPISAYPTRYIDLDGKEWNYEVSENMPAELKWLKRNITNSMFEKYVVPFMMTTNLKATKYLLNDKLRIALFVNKIFDYTPDFERNGHTIRRNQYPYFGMELNINL